MADTTMALNAIDLIGSSMIGDAADKLPMAIEAIFLQNDPTLRAKLDWFVKILERKSFIPCPHA
jgi:hypothetical protein